MTTETTTPGAARPGAGGGARLYAKPDRNAPFGGVHPVLYHAVMDAIERAVVECDEAERQRVPREARAIDYPGILVAAVRHGQIRALAAPPAPAPAGVEPPSQQAHALVEAALDACVAAERADGEHPDKAETRRLYTAALDARTALLDFIAHLEAPAPAPAGEAETGIPGATLTARGLASLVADYEARVSATPAGVMLPRQLAVTVAVELRAAMEAAARLRTAPAPAAGAADARAREEADLLDWLLVRGVICTDRGWQAPMRSRDDVRAARRAAGEVGA